MGQRTLSLLDDVSVAETGPEEIKVVGCRCEDEVVTLRFLGDGKQWGEPVRQITLDRKLAEQLTRFLTDELYQDQALQA